MPSVVIDGTRYVPDPGYPDGISIWYMHDNHTFSRIYGDTLDEVLSRVDAVEAQSRDGMLCPVMLLHGEKEVRRVGPSAMSGSTWITERAAWRAALEADEDVMRLLPANLP